MLDRALVTAYDAFIASRPAEAPALVERCWGPWCRARIIPTRPAPPEVLTGPAAGPSGPAPGGTANEHHEVVVLGAGPAGLVLAALLARAGHQVLVLEQRDRLLCGATWNVSRPELAELQATGVLSAAAWDEVICGEFSHGVFRLWDADLQRQREFPFDGILNLSLHAARLLAALARTPGVSVRLAAPARLAGIEPGAALVEQLGPGPARLLRARLVLDARGWSSPLAALVHPDRPVESVYNILGVHVRPGLAPLPDPTGARPLGLICATYGDEHHGSAGWVQAILERFSDWRSGRPPGGDVFYYFTRTARPAALAPLLDEMLARLPLAAPDLDAQAIDEVFFGHGPSYYGPGPLARWRLQTCAGDRVLLVGAAAQQYSGLTGCAFGCLARNAGRLAAGVHAALTADDLRFERLAAIDIDPRERASQAVGDLFAGAMALAEHEPLGACNRDWLAFCDAAQDLPAALKDDAFRDKLPLAALHRLIDMAARHPAVIAALVRNNRGHVATMTWTVLRSYLRLLALEGGLALRRRRTRYLVGSAGGLARLPGFVLASGRFYLAAHRAASPTAMPAGHHHA